LGRQGGVTPTRTSEGKIGELDSAGGQKERTKSFKGWGGMGR